MKPRNKGSEIFVPDGTGFEPALKRTTHMGISAHQDDLEIMAYHGILECFGSAKKFFTGVTVTDGAGSPRDALYARYSDAEMKKVRRQEQKKAAVVGEFSAMVFLHHPSPLVKELSQPGPSDDLKDLIKLAQPEIVYTHNLADKHDTHVAVAVRTIEALRQLDKKIRPKTIYGCEVWKDLDWLPDNEKVVLDVSRSENIAAALLGVFDSQISGGKRYDLATLGRRRANATFFSSHGTDQATALAFAMNLTPLIENDQLSIKDFVVSHIQRFQQEVSDRIDKL